MTRDEVITALMKLPGSRLLTKAEEIEQGRASEYCMNLDKAFVLLRPYAHAKPEEAAQMILAVATVLATAHDKDGSSAVTMQRLVEIVFFALGLSGPAKGRYLGDYQITPA